MNEYSLTLNIPTWAVVILAVALLIHAMLGVAEAYHEYETRKLRQQNELLRRGGYNPDGYCVECHLHRSFKHSPNCKYAR